MHLERVPHPPTLKYLCRCQKKLCRSKMLEKLDSSEHGRRYNNKKLLKLNFPERRVVLSNAGRVSIAMPLIRHEWRLENTLQNVNLVARDVERWWTRLNLSLNLSKSRSFADDSQFIIFVYAEPRGDSIVIPHRPPFSARFHPFHWVIAAIHKIFHNFPITDSWLNNWLSNEGEKIEGKVKQMPFLPADESCAKFKGENRYIVLNVCCPLPHQQFSSVQNNFKTFQLSGSLCEEAELL